MCANHFSFSEASNQEPLAPEPTKRSRRKFYTILGIIAVAVVAVLAALVFVFLIPPSQEKTIPLSYEYSLGEQMIYNVTVTGTSSFQQNVSAATETLSLNVIGFDGEYYTMNETMTASVLLDRPFAYSSTIRINKTGYILRSDETNLVQPFSATLFGLPQFSQGTVDVGESMEIPVNQSTPYYSVNGTISLKFGEIQKLTVPAGEYKVFRIDVSSSNVSVVVTSPTPANVTLAETFSVSGQMYLEYGTCRLVESDLQENIVMQGTVNMTESLGMHMELVQST